jgi:hypothetical protein
MSDVSDKSKFSYCSKLFNQIYPITIWLLHSYAPSTAHTHDVIIPVTFLRQICPVVPTVACRFPCTCDTNLRQPSVIVRYFTNNISVIHTTCRSVANLKKYWVILGMCYASCFIARVKRAVMLYFMSELYNGAAGISHATASNMTITSE